MGLRIRDDRQMQAFTGLSQAPCDSLRPVFTDMYQAARQPKYAQGVASGTRRRQPGGGSTGKRPPMAEQWLFVLSESKTSPPFDGLGQPCEMARSQAHAHRHTLSPLLYETLGPLALMPDRALATPEEGHAAVQGVARLRMDATARASHRATDAGKPREHDRGKKNSLRGSRP